MIQQSGYYPEMHPILENQYQAQFNSTLILFPASQLGQLTQNPEGYSGRHTAVPDGGLWHTGCNEEEYDQQNVTNYSTGEVHHYTINIVSSLTT